MFPNASFLGLDLYYWMMVIGMIVSLVVFRMFYKQAGMSDKVFNFCIIVTVIAIIFGYIFAVLFESWFVFLETGKFAWGVGATFYGGLIGGAAVYLALYFGVGHFYFKDRAHIAQFNNMLSVITPCAVVAHAFGRMGCLFDGCCYGTLTDVAGIKMWVNGEWQNRIPTQLYESLFLFALFFVLLIVTVKKKFEYTASAYLIAYGVWRFAIEFVRDDERGSSGISGLTPAQLIALLLIAAGVALIFIYKFVLKKYFQKAAERA